MSLLLGQSIPFFALKSFQTYKFKPETKSTKKNTCSQADQVVAKDTIEDDDANSSDTSFSLVEPSSRRSSYSTSAVVPLLRPKTDNSLVCPIARPSVIRK